jgi:hypothetical protein
MRIIPIGIQTFEDIQKRDAIYIDKIKEIYEMIEGGKFYFLSRPRRFGKSLLVSTFKELFKGNKQIFEGLYIYDKWDWSKTNLVIHLDFAEITYSTSDELKFSLNKFVELTAEENKVIIDKELPLSMKFAQLIKKLHGKTGNQVVILVDEYDKPLIDNLNKEVYAEVKRTLHDFYQVIKASDEHLRFVFLTGVSQFSGLSIFSGLNNLIDITMNGKYASICGYTQEELQRVLVELFANIVYDLITKRESYYHSLFLVAGVLSGYEVELEVHTDKGRIDAVLKKGKEVIVVEIKYGKGSKVEEMLEEAIDQIRNRKYYEKYATSEVSLLAIAFGDNKEIACNFVKL